ncbi:MAG TPA: SpoIIE family protein phosphatase [Firmicutes bacterium]|nr:SpoIIE family protein phosphatase [Candidatus Fermentithermobacillaceae bacterium]
MSRITDFVKNKLGQTGRKPRQELGSDGIERHTAMTPLYLVYVIAFLLGRVRIITAIAPFGPAFYVSYRTVLGGFSILAASAVLAGAASLGQWGWFVSTAVSIIGITVLTRPESKGNYPRVPDVLIAGFCVFMARVGVGIAAGPSFSMYLSAFIEGLCTMVSGLIFISALHMVSGADRPGSPSGKTVQALVLLSLFAIGGLQGVKLFTLDLGLMVTMAATLALAYAGGPGAGALAGILGGLVACLTGLEGKEIIGQLGIMGVLSGLGGQFGKIEATLGYLSAGLAMSFFSGSASIIRHRLLEQIIAAVVIVFIGPGAKSLLLEGISGLNHSIRFTKRRVDPDAGPMEKGDMGQAAIFSVLSEIGRLFDEAGVARSEFEEPVPGDQDLGLRGGERPRGTVLGRAGRGADKRGSGRSLEVSAINDSDISAIKQLFEKVCQDCGNRAFCWEQHFGETYEGFIGLARKARLTGKLSLYDSSLATADKCGRFREMVIHLNYEKHIDRLAKQLSSIESETIGCLSYQFKCLSQLAANIGPGRDTGAMGDKGPSFKVSVKGTTIAASGVDKPGDMWVRYDLDAGKTLLVLVDGMGKGEMAAKQSRNAVRLLKSLIDCGLDHQSCISFLNSTLHLAWRPDSFVALDCLVIDAEIERAYFYKLGAPPSFIRKSDGNVLAVRGSKPPAGAVTHVLCYGTSEPVNPGDLIFLVSDGVFRSSPVPARAEHMLMMRLGRLKENALDDCVKSLVNHSLRYQRQTPNDDITVVGALIESI